MWCQSLFFLVIILGPPIIKAVWTWHLLFSKSEAANPKNQDRKNQDPLNQDPLKQCIIWKDCLYILKVILRSSLNQPPKRLTSHFWSEELDLNYDSAEYSLDWSETEVNYSVENVLVEKLCSDKKTDLDNVSFAKLCLDPISDWSQVMFGLVNSA